MKSRKRALSQLKKAHALVAQSLALSHRADTSGDAQALAKARACAEEAIALAPALAAAYEARAYTVDTDGAIADFAKVVELDPHNVTAWLHLGGRRVDKAMIEPVRERSLALLTEAHTAYRRAAELAPDRESLAVAIIEAAICSGQCQQAVGTLGEWWSRLRDPFTTLLCAWLGAVAMIMLGRPQRRWSHLLEYLRQPRLEGRRNFVNGDLSWDSPTGFASWNMGAMQQYLKAMASEPDLARKHEQVRAVNELMMSHFQIIDGEDVQSHGP